MPKQRDRKELFIDDEDFKKGLYALEDTTKAPFGSARIMENVQVTDRGGIAPRGGTLLLGDNNTNANGVKGFYNFRKSFDEDEFLVKAYDDELEVYSKNHSSAGWFRLKNEFTSDKEFGFVTTLVNTDNEDYVAFCNRHESYQRWSGAVTLLDGALTGGETTITVDSVLTEEIFESKTATSATSTTIDVAETPWADDMWIGFYVYITSGTHNGKISLITDNDNNTITFDSLGSTPGTATFEIRKAAFPASGDLIYNGTTIAYTDIPTATSFTVTNAHASADNVAITLVPTEYPAAPRGNRFTNYLGRVITGNVRSALARDGGGALSGFASAGSYFVSKILNPFDFGFSANRIAGEGDIIATPYGGGDITDVEHQEDTAYIFKKRYIESVKYSQDANDLAVRDPIKAGVGSVGQVIKGSDDIYFISDDKKFTSIGRVESKDVLPQTDNVGINIKRLLDVYDFSEGKGIEDADRIYVPGKSSSSESSNDIVLIYNKQNKSFEGVWNISARYFERFDGKFYYAESNSPNVYQMNVGHSDVAGSDTFDISSSYATHFMNLTSSHGCIQAMQSLYFEGYIKSGTTINFKSWKDFSSSPFLSFDFTGDEETLLDGQELSASLGTEPHGLSPMGAVGEIGSDGRRHFQFRVYFPFQYGNHFSIGFSASGSDFDYEITRFGLGMTEDISTNTKRIKSI